jgi:hypothetical protein
MKRPKSCRKRKAGSDTAFDNDDFVEGSNEELKLSLL